MKILLLLILMSCVASNSGQILNLQGEAYLIQDQKKTPAQEGMKLSVEDEIHLLNGKTRMKIIKGDKQDPDQKIVTEYTTFTVREDSEIEIEVREDSIELDVLSGQVEASSPFINSFVPEYVRANEGLSYLKQETKFIKRKLREP